MKKNDLVTLDITGMTAQGSGVGRVDGMVLFVPMTAKGDRVKARVLKVTKTLAYGKVEEVLTTSADRVEIDCPVFHQCGGCAFRHISYQAECAAKTQKVADALQRIGKLKIQPQPIITAERVDGYRNKAQYPVGEKDGRLQLGFYAPHSHRVVNCRECRLQPSVFTKVLEQVTHWAEEYHVSTYDETTHQGLLRHVYLRYGFSSGEVMVCLVINGTEVPAQQALVDRLRATVSGLVGVLLNVNRKDTNVILGDDCRLLWGRETLQDQLCGLTFSVSPLSFYQVNPAATELLYAKAAEYAEPQGKEVLDLYCGAGTIGLSMANQAKFVTGVEVIPAAVENARRNAKTNAISNARFFCSDADAAADALAKEGYTPDVVILDPPRKGCAESVLQTVANRFAPERVVYVSCDPATLARDLARFLELGYETVEATPVDLFPRTAHIETCVLLCRSNS